MLLTILLAALQLSQIPAAPSAAPAPGSEARAAAGPAKTCPRATVRQADDKAPLRPRRFGELPSGRLEYAVIREVGGCPIPAVIRERIGGPAAGRE